MFRIADAHSDFAGFNVTPDQYGSEYDHADLDRMEKGGIALQIFADVRAAGVIRAGSQTA
jgi:hypothetical protein